MKGREGARWPSIWVTFCVIPFEREQFRGLRHEKGFGQEKPGFGQEKLVFGQEKLAFRHNQRRTNMIKNRRRRNHLKENR